MKQICLLEPVKKFSFGTYLSVIMAKVSKNPTSGCWEWTGDTNPKGYPQVVVKRRGEVSPFDDTGWTLSIGRLLRDFYGSPVPYDKILRRLCGNRKCVRPDHGVLACDSPLPTHARGSKHGRAKITEAQVKDIRDRVSAGEKAASVAAALGVTRGYVSKIINGKIWSHV